MSRSPISIVSRELVINRLGELVGSPQRVGTRGAFFEGEGSMFLVRTAESSTCRPDGRLHWTKVDRDNLLTIEERARVANQANRPFDLVFATLFDERRELLIWAVPYALIRDALGKGALYIRWDEMKRHVVEIAQHERPLGDLDLRAYLFCYELTDQEFEDVCTARTREN
jgi:hypothetical protein